jgi:hypothetical protein
MKKIALLFSAICFAVTGIAQSICFDPENDNRYPSGHGTTAIAQADFNDDGFLDVATTNQSSGNVTVLFGNNDGSFDAPLMLGSGGGPRSIVAADFNNDLLPDLIVRNDDNTSEIGLLINNGAGGFNNVLTFDYNSNSNQSVKMEGADVDNDGKTDIVINDYSSNELIVLRNNGNSTFTTLDVLSTSSMPDRMALGNLNNDNFPDLIVSYYPNSVSNDSISYYVNNGDGTYGSRTTLFVVDFAAKKELLLTDLNNDGLDEIICEGAADLRVFVNSPALTFTAHPSVFTGGYAAQILTGEFNGDSDADLLSVDYTSGVLCVIPGDGDGTFQPFQAYSVNGGPNGGVIGDFDNDLRADFIAANQQGYVAFVKGNVDGSFGSYSLRTMLRPEGFDIADVNEDTDLDIVVANGQSSFISVMINNSDGTFQNTSNQAVSYPCNDLVLGDFNNDNNLDVITANSYCELLTGNGAGVFTSAATVAHNIASGGTWFIAAAHLNTDAFLDFVIGVNNYDSVAVLLGNGNMTFQTSVKYEVGTTPNRVIAQDMNGDGRIDLLVSNDQSNDVSLLVNNGNGTFQAALSIPAANGPRGVAAGDFDDNGFQDIAVVNNNSNNITVHLASSALNYATGVAYTVTNSPNGIFTALINNDPFLDILVLNATGASVSLLTGNGDGTFNNPVEYVVEVGPYEVMAADFNEDGDRDIATVNHNANTVTVILNNGAYITASGPTQICDGESVVLTASGGYSYAWSNGETTASITVTQDATYSCSISNQSGTCILVPPSVPVTVNPTTVNVQFTQTINDPVCEAGDDISLQGGSPQGGTYSGAGVSNGIFTPSVAGDGTHEIKYTYTDPAGCATDSAFMSVVVDNFVAASWSGVFAYDTLCHYDSPIDLSGEGTPAGGDWFINGLPDTEFIPDILIGDNLVQYVVESGVCIDTAEAIITVAICSGIEETDNSGWHLFPNPFDNSITLQHTGTGLSGILTIENVTGQEVFRQAVSGTSFTVNPVLSSGIYQVRIFSEDGNRVFSVVRK